MTHGFRFVVVDPRKRLDGQVPTVSAANSSGADQATSHLLELGHRRIAAITGTARTAGHAGATARAISAALAAAGVMPDPELIVESDFDVAGGRARRQHVLDSPEPPTAIFAFNDQLAIGAIADGARARPARPAGPLDRRLRRHRRGGTRHARAHDRATAAGRDGPYGCQPADAPAREPADSKRSTSSSRPSSSFAIPPRRSRSPEPASARDALSLARTRALLLTVP